MTKYVYAFIIEIYIRAGQFNHIRIVPFMWLAYFSFVMACPSTFVYSNELFGFMA